MLHMMLRPRWVLALLAALGIAAGFALLGQWQLERAVEQSIVIERATEEVRPLSDVVAPDVPTEQAATGQRVEVRGEFVPGAASVTSRWATTQ
jgi:cytochrome oxidase assembly protein ShyY1